VTTGPPRLEITYNYASRLFAKYNFQLQVGFWHVLLSRITMHWSPQVADRKRNSNSAASVDNHLPSFRILIMPTSEWH
jgi:hypothetical protein